MFSRISQKLLVALAMGLLVVFMTETWIRGEIELPELYRLEELADRLAVAKSQAAWASRVTALEQSVLDYGVWDTSYDFLGRDPANRGDGYIAEVGPNVHVFNEINGVLMLDSRGQVALATSRDRKTGDPNPKLTLDFEGLRTSLDRLNPPEGSDLVGSGLIPSNLGNLVFAASRIRDSSSKFPPRGLLIFWRLMDDAELRDFSHLFRVNLTLTPVTDAGADPVLARKLVLLAKSDGDFLPRDEHAGLFWSLPDALGQPLYVVRQQAAARSFDDDWISRSSILSLIATALVLLSLGAFFSQSFARRVTRATDAMEKIQGSGQYDTRLPVEGQDELASMYMHFNALLDRIHSQSNELQVKNDELERLSEEDALTGIPNRRLLDRTLESWWGLAARGRRPLSALLLDVDFFKQFNDGYGHQRGDEVLRQVARILRDTLSRATDFVARFGGEEFCVILSDTDMTSALVVAETLRQAIQQLGIVHEYSKAAAVVTVSIGVASTVAEPKDSPMLLIERADSELYAAKAAGRNCVRVGRLAVHNGADVPPI